MLDTGEGPSVPAVNARVVAWFADGRIDPIRPEFNNRRSGSGFMAIDLLVGRRLIGPLHVKGGFTSGLAGDLHPFQPVVIVAFRR